MKLGAAAPQKPGGSVASSMMMPGAGALSGAPSGFKKGGTAMKKKYAGGGPTLPAQATAGMANANAKGVAGMQASQGKPFKKGGLAKKKKK